MENPFDTLARALRPVLIGLLFLAFPVFLFSYAQMLLMVLETWSGWAIAATVVSHALAFIGAASLHDHQSERRQSAARRDSQL